MEKSVSTSRCLASIERVRSRAATLSAVAGMLLWLGLILAAAGLLVSLDAFFRFPAAGRWFSLALWVAVLVIATRRVLLPALGGPETREVLLRLERCYPDLSGRLVTAVELADPDRLARSGASVDLYRQVASAAESMAPGLDPAPVVPARPYLRRSMAGLCIIVGALLGSIAITDGLGIGLRRLFAPWSAVAWPYKTQISIDGETPILVRRGGSLELTGRIGGRIPETGTLRVWSGSTEGTPYRGRFSIGAEGDFRVEYQPVTADLFAQLAAGDAQSDVLEVRMVPPPEIESVELRLEHPDYSGLPPAVLPDGNATALFGTRAELRITADKPLRSASILWHDGQGVPFTLTEPDAGVLSFEVLRDAAYTIDLVDTMGFRSDVSVTYRIEMVDNEYPRIESMEPRTDKQVTPEAEIPLFLELSDDFALAGATLYYRVNQEATEEVELPLDPGARRAEILYTWKIADLEVEPGDAIQYWVEVRDMGAHADERPYPESTHLRLSVMDDSSLRRRLNDRADQLLSRLVELVQLQTESSEAVATAAAALDAATDVRDALDTVRTEEYMQKRIRSQAARIGQLLSDLAGDYVISKVGRKYDINRIQAAGEELAALAAEPMPRVVSGLRFSIDLLEDHLRKQR
jgi:hypothetical protein